MLFNVPTTAENGTKDWKRFIDEDDLSPVIGKAGTKIDTYVKGYHVYKTIWKPIVNEEMETEMEPDNVMDKYLVYVKKKTSIVRHLPLSKNGKFAKIIFKFLRADQYAECKVVITRKEVNLGDGDGMFKLNISGSRKMVEIICKNIQCSTKGQIKSVKVKHELRVTSYKFKSTSYEFKFTSYEFKSTS